MEGTRIRLARLALNVPLVWYANTLEEFHSYSLQLGFAEVPSFCILYRSCEPFGPATIVPEGTSVISRFVGVVP